MKIPYFKAKIKNKDRYVKGFYFAMPEITHCVTTDYVTHPVNIIHCITTYHMTDWGLPNEPDLYEIDNDTLELIGWYDTQIKYEGTESWYEPINLRKWAIDNQACPYKIFGEDECLCLCDDCPDGCPLYSPNDPKNK